MVRYFVFIFILLVQSLAAQEESNPPQENNISYPIYFEYKVSTLDSIEERRLPVLFRNFDSFQITRIEIQAFCDERGTAKQNMILSKKRAASIYTQVKTILTKTDTNGNVLVTADGRGFLPLIGTENIEEQRSRNRRGDIIIYYIRKPKPEPKAKKPKVEPKAPEVKIENFFSTAKAGDKMELKIFFEGGRSTLLSSSFPELDSLVSILNANDSIKINILGHIYAGGYAQEIDAYDEAVGNNYLSENRAKVVYNYLIKNRNDKKGIDKKRLTYKGLGGRYPTGLSANRDRRVEIEIAGKEEQINNQKDSAIGQ